MNARTFDDGVTRTGRRHGRLAIEWTCHAGPGRRVPTDGTEVPLDGTHRLLLLVANEE
jgi:hypothetical protein